MGYTCLFQFWFPQCVCPAVGLLGWMAVLFPVFSFLRFFLMWTIFKVFIEFFTILLLFYVLFFWPWGMWGLSSPTRDRTLTSCIGKQSLNHWVTREISAFFFFLCCLWFLSICRLKAKDKSNQGRGVMLRKLRGNDTV